jgi:superfamily II DNA or RNA helicase
MTKEQKDAIKALPLEFPSPLVLVGKMHQEEQGESKCVAIEDLYHEFGKVLVFARYTQQLSDMEKYFADRKIQTWRLDGQTKNRKVFMQSAEKANEGIALVQASISSGYELPSFSCVVFASCSWSYVDYEQAKGRVLRANALKKNLYVHLIAGEVDKEVLAALTLKKDFNERIFIR